MDNLVTTDSFELQLKFENCLRLLTKKHNELSKKFTTNLEKKDSKFKVTIFFHLFKNLFCQTV